MPTGLQTGGLAFDLAGNLYVAAIGQGFDGTVKIFRITPAGVSSIFVENGFPGFGNRFPGGLAFDGTGNPYAAITRGNFSFQGDSFIFKYTPGGQETTFATSTYNFGPPNFDTQSRLGGIAFDSSGRLYAANPVNNAIEKFASGGGTGTVFADAADGLSSPSFIASRGRVVKIIERVVMRSTHFS